MSKPTIPDVLEAFVAYHALNPAWGSLHCVLDDGNVGDKNVEAAIAWAEEKGDEEGARLGRILLSMSATQRRKLPHMAWNRLRASEAPSL